MRILLILSFIALFSSHGQDFTLGDARTLPEPQPELPIYDYSPDGHYTVLRSGDTLTMFWPGHDSYRTTGTSIFEMRDCTKVLPMGGERDFDNGGAWLYTVFPRGDRRMLGFYHAEDHKFPLSPDSKWTAYKSIARCTSEDLGLTWGERVQILTAHEPKPETAKWSGLGDHCIVWDEKNDRFVCFYQEDGILCMAMSADPEGKPGSWRKWFKGDFTEPGLGGRATPVPDLATHRGGNPSVHWNTFLQRWAMVWHRWKGDLWISTSEDLTTWTPPKLLLSKPSETGKVWYPNLVGESDTVGGARLFLLYADYPDGKKPFRHFKARQLVFRKESQ